MQRRIFFGALLVSGCATKYDRLREYRGADAGLMVISFGMATGNAFTYSALQYRRRGTDELGIFYYNPVKFSPDPKDFEDANGHGTVFAQQLPPGEYELYTFFGSRTGVGVEVLHSPTIDFSIPFTVRAGEVSYVGRYTVAPVIGSDSARPVGARLLVAADQTVDVLVAKKKAPAFSAGAVATYAPDGKRIIDPSTHVIQR